MSIIRWQPLHRQPHPIDWPALGFALLLAFLLAMGATWLG
jgi:hypothetical protein